MHLLIDARRALFAGLIDYAGLFPPASLTLEDAIAEYRNARSGPQGWMIGRFLCPSSRLEDLVAKLTASMQPGEVPWPVSAIFDEPLGVAAMHAAVFDRYMEPAASIILMEAKLPAEASDGRSIRDAEEVIAPLVTAAAGISPTVLPFLEIVRTEGRQSGISIAIGAIAGLSRKRHRPLGAKLRTGGAIPEAFPSSNEVALFIEACVDKDLPFKVTAGLHHAVRHHDLDLGVDRHGFLNLLAATALKKTGADRQTLVDVIADDDRTAFHISAVGLRWRQHLVGLPTLRDTRTSLVAHGSCSVTEPIADLAALKLLPAGLL